VTGQVKLQPDCPITSDDPAGGKARAEVACTFGPDLHDPIKEADDTTLAVLGISVSESNDDDPVGNNDDDQPLQENPTRNDGSPGEVFSARRGEVCDVQISSTRAPQMVGQVLSKRLDPDEFSRTPAPEITPVVADLAIRLDPDKLLSCHTVFSSFALQRLGQVLTTRLDPDEHSKKPAPQMSPVLKDLAIRLDPDEWLLEKFRLYVPSLPDWYSSVLWLLG
jgi:hypothetical protein